MSEIRMTFRNKLSQLAGEKKASNSFHVTVETDLLDSEAVPERVFELRFGNSDTTDLTWYLERYVLQPRAGAARRARDVEAMLESWSSKLPLDALGPEGLSLLNRLATASGPRYLTIAADSSFILSLPWEIASANGQTLAELGVLVRRRGLTSGVSVAGGESCAPPAPVSNALRVLLVVSRPDELGYIDHRCTPRILDEIGRSHAGALQFDLCTPPTLERFAAALAEASAAGNPYGVIHFDGHGAYNSLFRRAELCFEGIANPTDNVTPDFVTPQSLRAVVERQCRPAVLVLEACQTAQVTPLTTGFYDALIGTKRDLIESARAAARPEPDFSNSVELREVHNPAELRDMAAPLQVQGLGGLTNERDLSDVPLSRSVAGLALAAGIDSVIGMSHTVHVDGTAIFVRELYGALVTGQTVAASVNRGRSAMRADRLRRVAVRANGHPGQVELQDWCVPQLYQAARDEALQALHSAAPAGCVFEELFGRGELLLRAERRLLKRRALLLRGLAGAGKTASAAGIIEVLRRAGLFRDGVYRLPGAGLPVPWPDLHAWLATHDALLLIDPVEQILWDGPVAQSPNAAVMNFLQNHLKQPSSKGCLLMTTRLGQYGPIVSLGIDTLDLRALDPVSAEELLCRRLAERGRHDAFSRLDEGLRFELITRLQGNPGAIETAVANWPEADEQWTPDSADLDGWMAACARLGFRPEPGDDLGLAACPLHWLAEDVQRMLPLLAHFRGRIGMTVIRGIAGLTDEQALDVVSAWARIGLVEHRGDSLSVIYFHPWVPYRIGPGDANFAAELAAQLNATYGGLFAAFDQARAGQPRALDDWLTEDFATLHLQFTRAVQRGLAGRAVAIGLLLDEVLRGAGVHHARVRQMRALEALTTGADLNPMILELRLRACDCSMFIGHRNGAVAIAAAALVLMDASQDMKPLDVSARAYAGIAATLVNTGYHHGAAKLYCRAIASWVAHGATDAQARLQSQHYLAECFGGLAEVLFMRVLIEQAWLATRCQHMTLCAAWGDTNRLFLEPLLRYVRLLVEQRSLEKAEALFDTLLGNTAALDDEMLADWYETRGGFESSRKLFGESAQHCMSALAIRERLQNHGTIRSCYTHMGIICFNTGRISEARAWFTAALEIAWQQADRLWASQLIDKLAACANKVTSALAWGNRLEDLERAKELFMPELRQWHARLRGLREYCAEADTWVESVLGLEDASATVPLDFDWAAEILRWLTAQPLSQAPNAPRSKEELMQYFVPTEPAPAKTYLISTLLIDAIIENSAV